MKKKNKKNGLSVLRDTGTALSRLNEEVNLGEENEKNSFIDSLRAVFAVCERKIRNGEKISLVSLVKESVAEAKVQHEAKQLAANNEAKIISLPNKTETNGTDTGTN